MTIQALLNLVRGKGLNQLSGPVGIYQATATYASLGFGAYMMLVAQISLNVGIFNLLPLPVLDGGHLIIILIEAITRRKLPAKALMYIQMVGIALLVTIFVYATAKDIIQLL